jgi:hypothetical protein
MKFRNKLECLSLVSLFSRVQGRLEPIRVDYLKGTPSRVGSWTFPQTLDYYEDSKITYVKGFVALGPGANIIKLFTAVIYEFL